ncbi:unnamed protein product [Protopolystoma xenopodis]|uniref:Ig-like domain-containing protein n=1 Tax=Protopolystoma xenopodis TaxID=117903 RepID=A0A3S5AKL8_9PLAT|nr:unnamed protein product [Protopolystoma xenopodis]
MFTIFRTVKEDTGTYQCNASNPVGWDIVEYDVRVRGKQLFWHTFGYVCQVTMPPQIDASNWQREVHWFVNQSRSLDCTLMAGADPPATITWERGDIPLRPGPNLRISPDGTKVTVPLVSQRDAGEYRCRAQNEAGNSSIDFNVFVYGKPQCTTPASTCSF